MKAIGTTGPRPATDPAALVAFDAPEPTLRPRDLLVQVKAVSLNPVDTKVRNSRQPEAGQTSILGYDAAGVVVGVEADAQYLDFGRGRNNAFVSGAVAPGYYVTDPRGLSSLDYFGTVRGRLGYAFDRTLVYGTGGFAYGSGSADRSFGGYAGNDSFRTGYAVGGGIEYALPTDSFLNFFRSSAVTLKVEGLYVNLDRNTRNQGALVVNAANNFPVAYSNVGRRDDEFAVVRAGLNYKFGSY